MSNWSCHVANNLTNFTVYRRHTAFAVLASPLRYTHSDGASYRWLTAQKYYVQYVQKNNFRDNRKIQRSYVSLYGICAADTGTVTTATAAEVNIITINNINYLQ